MPVDAIEDIATERRTVVFKVTVEQEPGDSALKVLRALTAATEGLCARAETEHIA